MNQSEKELLKTIRQIESENAVPDYDPSQTLPRIQKAVESYEYFVNTYFAKYAEFPCDVFHLEAAEHIRANRDCVAALIWGRGFAKSTTSNIMIPIWLACQDELHFMVLIGKDIPFSQRLLADLRTQFTGETETRNEKLLLDFGVQVSEADVNEFTIRIKTFDPKTKQRKVNFVTFMALSANQEPQGLRKHGKRPDYMCFDDCDSDDYGTRPDKVKETMKWIDGPLRGCFDAGKNKTIKRFVWSNNLFVKNGLTDTFVKKANVWVSKVNALTKPEIIVKSEFNWKYSGWIPSWKAKYSEKYFYDIWKSSPTAFEAHYMNNPPKGGGIFDSKDIQYADLSGKQFIKTIIYIDPAFKKGKKSDFTACKVWATCGKNYYLLDCFVRRSTVSEAVAWLYEARNRYPTAEFYIEEAFFKISNAGRKPANGREQVFPAEMFMEEVLEQAQAEQLEGFEIQKALKPLDLIRDRRRKGDKVSRISATSMLYEKKKIFYNQDLVNSEDITQAVEQLLAFPGHKHDDSPDADEGAIYILRKACQGDSFFQMKTVRRLSVRY